MRRTTTVDALWPDGPHGDLVLDGRGRDLRTTAEGDVEVIDEATMSCRIDQETRAILALDTTPPERDLRLLVGSSAQVLRRAPAVNALAVVPALSLLAALLDEVPVVAIISEGARRRLLGHDVVPTDEDRERDRPLVDICAGWARGGAMAASLDESEPPFLGHGPPVVPLGGHDELAFHRRRPLDPGSIRRLRRIDVEPAAGGTALVDEFYRDSFVEPDGIETAVHEYTVTVTVDRRTGDVVESAASAHVLPGPDCHHAVSTAAMVSGRRLTEARGFVETSLRGTIGCTHLNDSLRALSRVDPLLAFL